MSSRDVRKDIDKPTLLLTVSPDPSNGLTEIKVLNTTEILSSVLANVSTPSSGYIYRTLVYQGSNKWNASFTVTENGLYTININGTDLAGNIEYNSTSITGDIGGPSISLVSILPNPSNGLTTITASNGSSDINGNGIRANVTTPSAGIIHIDLVYQGSNTWNATFTVIENGTYTIWINATDILSDSTHIGPSTISGDLLNPSVTISSPIGTSGINPPNFDVTISDTNLDTTWYSIFDGIQWSENKIFTGATGTIDQTLWDSILKGDVIIRFFGNDTLGNIGYADTSVTKEVASTPGGDGGDPGGTEPGKQLTEEEYITIASISLIAVFAGGFVLLRVAISLSNHIKNPVPVPREKSKKPKKKSTKNYK
jgi:hypothetical protein